MHKIMVVDDEPDIRRLLEKRLRAADYEVVSYPTAIDALAALKADQPDLVLLDVNMPQMDGWEACRRIVSEFPKLPVLFLSALSDIENKLVGFEAGARDYIAKPFSPAELLARVRATLKEKDATEEAEDRAYEFELASITDPLTGLFNRRYLASRLAEELSRSVRYDCDVSCMMIDIDNFKPVNDTYGHAAGDRVLVEVAKAMKETLRAVDILGRYGGEEFTAILPETEISQALVIAERLRENVEKIDLGPDLPRITTSVGVAAGPTDDLVERADRALYRAKARGKNRVEH